MKKPSTILCCGAVLLSSAAAGFATVPVDQPIAAATADFDLPLALTEKMQRRAPFDLIDLQVLAQRRVPDDTIIAYLRSTGASVHLTTAAIDPLRAAGVTDRVINYLLLTTSLQILSESPAYVARPIAPRYGYVYRPYRPKVFPASRFGGSPGRGGGHRGVGHHGGGHRGGHHGGHR